MMSGRALTATAIGAAALFASGFTAAVRFDSGVSGASDVDRFVDASGISRHGVIVVFNPVTCTLNASQARALNELAARFGGQGVALIDGGADSLEAQRALRDLGLRFTVRLLGQSSPAMGVAATPLVAVVRGGEAVLIARGYGFESLELWAPSFGTAR